MKKYFSFVLALIMILSGCSQANPPRTSSDSGSVSGNANAQHSEALGFICIEDISTLEDIREVLTMDDMNEEEFMEHVLSAYPRVPIGGTGITKQDFADMLKVRFYAGPCFTRRRVILYRIFTRSFLRTFYSILCD